MTELERLKSLNKNCACINSSCDDCGERCLQIVELLGVNSPTPVAIYNFLLEDMPDLFD